MKADSKLESLLHRLDHPDCFTDTTDRNLMSQAAAAIRSLAAPWQPIETAPTDGTLILVCRTGMWETPRIVLFRDGAWWSAGGQWISDARSHWMPLPKLPAAGGADD